MKKYILIILVTFVLGSCQAPTEKPSNEATVIGYEFNDEGVKQNIVAGDVAITDVYMDYIQAHNDKNLDKIHEITG